MIFLSMETMVRQCTDQVKAGLLPFVEQEMQAAHGQDWERRAGCQIVAGTPHWDLQALLKTMLDHWQTVFDKTLPRTARRLVYELKDWRNHVAHEHEMTLEDTARMIDTAARLLKIIGAPQAVEIESLRLKAHHAIVATANKTPGPVQDTPDTHVKTQTPAHQPTLPSSAASPSTQQVHVSGAPSRSDCVVRLGVKLGVDFTRKLGCSTFSSDNQVGVCCLTSKEYTGKRFWWNLRERQLRDLTAAHSAFIAFACGSADAMILIPMKDFTPWLPTFNPKPGDDGEGWHIHILHDAGKWWLLQMGRDNRIDITQSVI